MRDIDSAKLLRAIRSRDLAGVQAALDAGIDPELPDEYGDRGLPLRIACFNGSHDIIRELVRRGARVDVGIDGMAGVAVGMAMLGGQPETVRLLLELGAAIPAGLDTGLSREEILALRDRQTARLCPLA